MKTPIIAVLYSVTTVGYYIDGSFSVPSGYAVWSFHGEFAKDHHFPTEAEIQAAWAIVNEEVREGDAGSFRYPSILDKPVRVVAHNRDWIHMLLPFSVSENQIHGLRTWLEEQVTVADQAA